MSVLPGGTDAGANRAPTPGVFDASSDLAYFTGLWETREKGPVSHTPELWDRRAGEWIGGLEDSGGKHGTRDRAEAAALYLRSRGLLGGDDAVIDVGCGPGLFAAKFAETAGHVTGLDYSARFIEYAERYAAGRGVKNVTFRRCDFTTLDIDAEELAGAFDLVFTSITPAASGKGCMDKLMRMSRGWCCNASFVHAEDDLAERVSLEVFGEKFESRWNGRGFYALANLLWLSGYYPETTYYDETRDELVAPAPSAASELASRCGREGEGDARRVLRYLEKTGEIRRRSRFRYGVILWDVTRRDRR
ncbi:MAG: class I SAM-dependent methyltransferase [Oscillospiraceae bacterium]|jgi:SAM-dependent methyltransferase|nr:class I SAM-dependent methyltransferase [Oscillospiraceae bacterium]